MKTVECGQIFLVASAVTKKGSALFYWTILKFIEATYHRPIGHIFYTRVTLKVINRDHMFFRGFLSQFSTDFHEILQTQIFKRIPTALPFRPLRGRGWMYLLYLKIQHGGD